MALLRHKSVKNKAEISLWLIGLVKSIL